jgi:hypothetical protein
MEVKRFSVFPRKSGFRPGYVRYDTQCIADMLGLSGREYRTLVDIDKSEVWSRAFNMDKRAFRYDHKHFDFEYMMSTDGVGVSLQFIRKDRVEGKARMKRLRVEGRAETFAKRRQLSPEEYEAWKKEKNDAKKQAARDEAKRKMAERKQEHQDRNAADPTVITDTAASRRSTQPAPYRPWTSDRAREVLLLTGSPTSVLPGREPGVPLQWPANPEPVTMTKRCCEFPYFDDPVRGVATLEDAARMKHVGFIDPGNRDLITAIDTSFTFMPGPGKRGHRFMYSQRRFKHECRTTKTNNKVAQFELDHGVEDARDALRETSGKAVNLAEFVKYAAKRTRVFEQVCLAYHQHLDARVARWHSYLNRRRAQDMMLRDLCRKFSPGGRVGATKDDRPVIVQGDWSRVHRAPMKGWQLVRNVGLTRLMSKMFNVFLIDEYGTSSRHYKTFEPCKSVFVQPGGEEARRRLLHSVLIRQENLSGHVQRDTQAAYNMRTIFYHWLRFGSRHPAFARA